MEFLRLPLHIKTTPQGGAIHFSRITLSETPGPKAFKKAEGGGGEGFWINVLRGHMHLIASCLECPGCLARRMTLSYRSKRVSPTHEDVVFGVLNLK